MPRPRLPRIPEPLEPRTLFSSAFPNVNISKTPGNQAEGAISVDPGNPLQLFAASNVDEGDGILVATSADGGATWTPRTIADSHDGLPAACCDPTAAFDTAGNLFLAYLSSDADDVVVLVSTDAGASFSKTDTFHGDVDQPTITTGLGSVWVTFQKSNNIVATGAAVSGLGAVGSFGALQKVHASTGANFGDIAIGSAGQVMVTFQKQLSPSKSNLFVAVDADGLGSGTFNEPVLATTTRVPDFDYIPAQSTRGIDAEAGLAFDRSGGAFNGRAYLLYTEETPARSANTDILLRYSDDQGVTWSAPARVNDDAGLTSQFSPRLSLDDATGQVAVGWYDTRDDTGSGTDDWNHLSNDDAGYYAALVTPAADGLLVSPNQRIAAGVSDAYDADSDIDLGDYTGLSFVAGVAHPLWFDNSNSTGDNPDGADHELDVYTASVLATSFASAAETSLSGISTTAGPAGALAVGGMLNRGFVQQGNRYVITIAYPAAANVDAASIDTADLLITGPNGFSAAPASVRLKTLRDGSLRATYTLINPGGKWKAADAGTYLIHQQPIQVFDTTAQPAAAGILGAFAVTIGHGRTSHGGGGAGPRHHPRGGGDPDQD